MAEFVEYGMLDQTDPLYYDIESIRLASIWHFDAVRENRTCF